MAHVGSRRIKARANRWSGCCPTCRLKRTGTYVITLIKREKAGSGRPLTDEQEQARHRLFEEARLLNEFAPASNVSVAVPNLGASYATVGLRHPNRFFDRYSARRRPRQFQKSWDAWKAWAKLEEMP